MRKPGWDDIFPETIVENDQTFADIWFISDDFNIIIKYNFDNIDNIYYYKNQVNADKI